MFEFIQNHKGKIEFKAVILGLAVVLVLMAAGTFLRQQEENIEVVEIAENIERAEAADELLDVRIPMEYSEPLVIASFNKLLSIQPVNARSSEMIKEEEGVIRYIEVYESTDIEQIRYPSKLKESLILKTPNHPERFEYRVNMDDFLWEVNDQGDILFKQKEYEERFEIEEVRKGYVRARMNTDYTDGHPILFRIPAPFLIDAAGDKSSKDYVKVEFQDDKLILIPDKEWLMSHEYPIVLDPTVEVIAREEEVVEFGSVGLNEFRPEVKLNKWGDEAYVSLEYETIQEGEFKLEEDKIKWQSKSSVDVEMYKREPQDRIVRDEVGSESTFKINQQGGIEFDLILKEKPASNIFNYKLRSKGLNFYYQPALHPEHPTWATSTRGDIIATRRMSEEAVGSYAVYHKNKKQGKYRTGKAFHIYRPKIYDASGDWIWGELKINQDNTKLSIRVDQDWLENASYPVRVDPNLGYDTAGGSSMNTLTGYSYQNGDAYTTDASGGIIGDAYIYAGGTTGNAKMAIYDGNNWNSELIVDSTSDAISITSTAGWRSAGGATGSLSALTNYYPAFVVDSDSIDVYYDSGNNWNYNSATYATFPFDTWQQMGSWSAEEFSFYFEYAVAPTAVINKVKLKSGTIKVKGGIMKINKIDEAKFGYVDMAGLARFSRPESWLRWAKMN